MSGFVLKKKNKILLGLKINLVVFYNPNVYSPLVYLSLSLCKPDSQNKIEYSPDFLNEIL